MQAFLAQVRHESKGLIDLAEIPGPYQVNILLDTFQSPFRDDGKNAEDAVRNPFKSGQVVNKSTLQILTAAQAAATNAADKMTLTNRQARFYNLKAYIQELGLNDLNDVTMVGSDVAKYSNGTSAESLVVGQSGGRWTEAIRNTFLDRYLSEDVGRGVAGNGKEAEKVAHNWLGRGLIHMTHQPPFEKFMQYIQDNHPNLVTPDAGKTVKQTLLANTKLIVDIENNPNSRMLAALSGAWYWGEYTNTGKGPSINTKADLLDFDPGNATEEAKFNVVSTKVNGNDQLSTRWKIYRDNVALPILTGGNPYEDMVEALKHVGITAKGTNGYETQFGISLRKRTPVEIDAGVQALMADTPAPELPYADKMPILLASAQAAFNFEEGEFTMWVPDVPTQYMEPPAIYLAANVASAKMGGAVAPHKLGVCMVINYPADIHPTGDAEMYLAHYAEQKFKFDFSPAGDVQIDSTVRNFNFAQYPDGSPRADTSVSVIAPPRHGTLLQENPDATDYTKYFYKYIPDEGYADYDRFALEVKGGGFTVEIYYLMSVSLPGEPTYVLDENGQKTDDLSRCPLAHWKISTSSPQPLDLATIQRNAALSALLADASRALTGFADLPAGAVGQTTGTNITLDTNAAGHGWFIDSTPLDNTDDYLPTSDPTVWQAKPGSEAEGKMDMLSVLLHEYGHAIGLEHSTDAHDFMGAVLPVGERRLPTADELTLMSQLVAQLKQTDPAVPTTPQSPFDPSPLGGVGLLALGRLRRGDYGWTLADDNVKAVAPSVPQYQIAANATLENGKFEGVSSWATQGGVNVMNGTAELHEVATSQTRLNQVFLVGPQDKFLSFTLNGIALDDQATGPDDAFEVGLLNANTGVSLAAPIGLTHTDAMLNLQANGSELAAQGVTHIVNPDGSRTYRVDLSGIPAGTAINLSFDLIGFRSER
ncbi:matrixin family metalloprotease [Polaromonas sp. P2-4]|nr:matrixin family metalloprotease [Polaromonas sp. P2-4]